MELNAEQRRARARLAANSRWHRDRPELLNRDQLSLERARNAAQIDRLIDRLSAPRDSGAMTTEQLDRLNQFAQALGQR